MLIVVIQHGVMVFDGGHYVEQSRKQICFRISDTGGVIRQTVHDALDMARSDLTEPILHKTSCVGSVTGNLGHRALVHSDLDHGLNEFIQLSPIVASCHDVILNLLFYSLSDSRSFVHSFLPLCLIDRCGMTLIAANRLGRNE